MRRIIVKQMVKQNGLYKIAKQFKNMMFKTNKTNNYDKCVIVFMSVYLIITLNRIEDKIHTTK